MDTFFYTCLFVFGTLFGSFASVLIYRLKSQEGGIMTGRSHCAKCNTILQAIDLIPIVSWLKNKAKCGYCKEQISSIYPLLELSTGLLFMLIGYFLIDYNLIFMLNSMEIIKLIFWLVIGFITIIYTFYDILFLEIHEGVLLSGIGLIVIGLSLQTLMPGVNLIDILPSANPNIWMGLSAIFITLIIIALLYLIMLKELHEIVDIIIILFSIFILYLFKVHNGVDLSEIAIFNGLIGAMAIFIFFYLQILVSRGAWMGGGDLRIAIMIGLILGVSFSFPGLMITYIVGSIIGIAFIIHSKLKNKGGSMDTQIPFGPFLAIGFFITVLFNEYISEIIKLYLG